MVPGRHGVPNLEKICRWGVPVLVCPQLNDVPHALSRASAHVPRCSESARPINYRPTDRAVTGVLLRLQGLGPSNFDEGLALNTHEDSYHPQEIGRFHPDAELEKVIKELLGNSKRIDASDITVVVDHSNVKLSGSVKSQFDRDYAESVVKLVHGVGNVSSELIVKINPGILPTDVGRNPG